MHFDSSYHYFFIHRWRYPRDLHSFPTRRSSDLLSAKFLSRVSYSPRTFAIFFSIAESSSSAIEKDRKSTRLNSSHVSISYAVFCLKKKNVISAAIGETS